MLGGCGSKARIALFRENVIVSGYMGAVRLDRNTSLKEARWSYSIKRKH
jgi:hypothetical protein